MTILAIIKTLILQPNDFTTTHAETALTEIMQNHATSAQIAAFLVALKLNHKDSDPAIVAACSKAMLKFTNLDLSVYEGLQDSIIDIVGTGGDGMDTFNVSTTASIVIAGAGSASSKSGSADILEKVGCEITKVTSQNAYDVIKSTDFCFLFAQNFYSALSYAASTRREIGVPTILNLLGPISNPAKPKRVVIGVHSKSLGKLVIEALKLKGVIEAMVVNGAIGLDEISTEGETFVWHLSQSNIREYTISPVDFDLPSHPISAVKGGTPQENADLLIKLLSNEYEGPILDFVLLNASAALVVAGLAKDFKDGVILARKSIRSGKAKNALDNFRDRIKNLHD
ncbi:10552_t:CDS:2 [Funneliformis caledonium]|uniref:Anthranilate phosphoribosyltransferase n=1 Tax=Funneliformis caledonium TaxID=1117310 RepID=A0A9N9A6P9_9GLOM|nr:10552_t:CDS:2 [Funneliformis caledonium]